jgi:PqqD family protein of HPr-rel-A system
MNITTTELYRRAEELPFRALGKETVVVNTRSREVHVLNGTGAHIWNLLATPQSLAQLMEVLAGEFDLDPEAARGEVASFVADLVDKGLVTVSPGSAP